MSLPTLFDGSHLGSHRFIDVVKWCSPLNSNSQRLSPALRALLYVNGKYHCVILKKNPTKFRTQCFIDELKPIFGLRKIGTNTIELDGVIRKKYKEYPWICSNSQIPYDNFGYPIIESEVPIIPDYFTHDLNVYIHKLKTMYYVFSVATYTTNIMSAGEENSFVSALSAGSLSSDDDDNEEEAVPELTFQKSDHKMVLNLYPQLLVKNCCWFTGAPGPWSKEVKKRKICESPTDEQQILYYEMQKIFIFRNLLELNFVYKSDCIFSPRRDFEDSAKVNIGHIPISINEFRFRNPNAKSRKNPTVEEKFYFPESTTYYQVLNIMIVKRVLEDEEPIDLNDICTIFSDRLLNLARTKFPQEIYHINKLIEKISNAFLVYNNIMLRTL